MKLLVIGWGVGGVLYLLGSAVFRLTPLGLEALGMDLSVVQLSFLALWLPFMGYSEGYRGFQKRFAPRVASRAWHLSQHPQPLRLLLAPMFCMGYFGATRRRKIASWAITTGIVGLVAVVKLLPQPWRGLVDLGVVLGLAWGMLALIVQVVTMLRTGRPPADPQLPPAEAALLERTAQGR